MTSKSNLVINPQRLWDSIMDTAKFGGTAKGGIKRLTVSDEDKRVRDWFKAQCEALGCKVQVDSVGNMFATRAGKRKDLLPIALGFGTDPSFRAPMAIVVIGGLITSTFLSLLVVPVVFTYVDDMVQWFARHWRARFPGHAQEAVA